MQVSLRDELTEGVMVIPSGYVSVPQHAGISLSLVMKDCSFKGTDIRVKDSINLQGIYTLYTSIVHLE